MFFYTEKSVDVLTESNEEYLKSQGYSDEQIDEWNKPKKWNLFYKLLGAFGLVITSIGILISIKHLFD